MAERTARTSAARWLLLIHQLPAKPAYLRVKVWRRLQGSAPSRSRTPSTRPATQAQEDFEWLLREISRGAARRSSARRLLEGLTDQEVRPCSTERGTRRLRGARQGARAVAAALPTTPPERRRRRRRSSRAEGAARPVPRSTSSAPTAGSGRGAPPELEVGCARRSAGAGAGPGPRRAPGPDLGDAHGRPRRPHRVGLADPALHRPGASLQVRAAKGYVPEPGELPFDMFEAEFTHEGDRCTFEVLLERAGLGEPRSGRSPRSCTTSTSRTASSAAPRPRGSGA